MSKSQYIAAHEPEEELLSPEDAWEDYQLDIMEDKEYWLCQASLK